MKKKRVISLILIFMVLASLVGCSRGGTNSNANYSSNQLGNNSSSGILSSKKTIGDFLNSATEEQPLVLFDVSQIDKNEVPEHVYIFQDGLCLCFENNGSDMEFYKRGFPLSYNLSELSSMTDMEIIQKYRQGWADGYFDTLEIWKSNQTWCDRIFNYEATLYFNDFQNYEIALDTDSSGNNVKCEWLMLPKHQNGKRTYTMFYDGWAYSDSVEGSDFDRTYFGLGDTPSKDFYKVCNVYKVTDSNVSGVIGNTNYSGLNAGDRKLIYKANNINLDFDDKGAYKNDIKNNNLYQDYIDTFINQYENNYLTIDEIADKFKELNIK